ncbi:MAG: hypothetical protein NZM02_02025 [Patescibacteria group bacterium]|nr:hypothetical protein [Patescibacteria group bacterium]
MEDIFKKIKSSDDIFEKARLIRDLIRNKDIQIKKIAENLGVSSSYVCHLERILNLPEMIVDGYYSKLITISHLFLISRVKDKEKLIKIYEKILAEGLTISQTDDLIREELYQVSDRGDYLKLEEKNKLVEKFNKKFKDVLIKIIQTKKGAKIIFEIKGNLEKTSRLIKKIFNEVSQVEDF